MFVVAVHDVTPRHHRQLTLIVRQLAPLVQHTLSAAVVPCWHGRPLTPAASAGAKNFAAWVKAEFDEILLHGYTHRQNGRGGPVGWLTGQANEFSGLSADAARERLQQAQAIFAEVFGESARGFVPPAWQWGPITPVMLADCGFGYGVGFAGIHGLGGAPVPLATWSWDSGRFPPLGYVGEAAGTIMFRLRTGTIPCVVFHPLDVERGFITRGVRWVERLLAEGKRPATFNTLAAQASVQHRATA